MIRWFLFGVICAALWTQVHAATVAGSDPVVVDYLRRHATPLDLRLPDAGLDADSIATNRQRIFLLGEVHGVAANYTLDLALLRHLHRVAGARVYLMEFSHANAQYMKRFLATGDPEPPDFALGQMHGFVDYSEERRHFFAALREWNLTLPAAERVRVVGFDLERMPGILLAFNRQQLADLTPPSAIRESIERLRALSVSPSKAEVSAVVTNLSASVAAHCDTYAALLKERWFDFNLVLNNLADGEQLQADRSHYDARRDVILFKNFTRIETQNPFSTGYGRVGSAHVLQQATGGMKHFSTWLETPVSFWAGQVVGIWPLYADCHRLAFAHGRYTAVPWADDPAVTQPFVASATTNVVLFKLTGADSPFTQQLLLPDEAKVGVTTDYFQYVVLFKSATTATPLSGINSGRQEKRGAVRT